MKVWTWVIIGGTFETVWALTMKQSEGFTVIPWTLVTIAFMFVSVGLLNIGLKRGVPVGGGYAVWAGVGAVGSLVMGIILYHESLAILKFVFAAVILIGIAGVELSCRPEVESENKMI